MPMEIRLGESDSLIHSGKAKMIIVHVTLNDGRKFQFPYKASTPIWKLYEAVAKIKEEPVVVPMQAGVSLVSSATAGAEISSVFVPASPNGEIKKGDIVRCIKVEDRGQGATVDRLSKEIKKCEIRCANCHQRKTILKSRKATIR
jgi:hypothetical protein